MTKRLLVAATGLLLAAAVASAGDGVLEINQACAVNTGCFPGDAAGYPVTVDGSAGRSYRLTSDLVVPDENTSGIEIDTSSVSVDLNGFEILRSGCEGTIDCTPVLGSATGVLVSVALYRGVSVRNGTITGMGNSGVFLGVQGEARNLRVRWNRLVGISSSTGSIVAGNTSHRNGGVGISAGLGSVVSGNTVFGNGGDGVVAESASMVSGNAAFLNGGFGLQLSGDSGYRENAITDNTAGTVSGGVDLGGNLCDGAATCP